jgi:hypothetical protein
MHYTRNNIGVTFAAKNLSHAALANGAGTRNGTAFRFGTNRSCVILAHSGAVTGSPTTQSAIYKLQSSPDGSAWTDVETRDGDAVTVTLTAASDIDTLNVDLQEVVPDEHDRVRLLETVSFSGGTSPTFLTGAVLIFGGGQNLPASVPA